MNEEEFRIMSLAIIEKFQGEIVTLALKLIVSENKDEALAGKEFLNTILHFRKMKWINTPPDTPPTSAEPQP